MASSSSSSSKANKCHIRSISLPSRSHPSTAKVEEELGKLKAWEESSANQAESEAICSGLSGLDNLYRCMDGLLNLPLTQQAVRRCQEKDWINELLDGSVKLLDVCGTARDVVSQMKERVRDLQSSLRRRKGDSSNESSSVIKYTEFRKKLKKDAKRMISTLKKAEGEIGGLTLFDLDQHLSSLLRVLREASTTSTSIFQSVLLFLSATASRTKSTARWSLVSKLTNKGVVISSFENRVGNANEVETVDAAVSSLCRHGCIQGEKMQIAQNRLEALESCIEGIENGLECMFRHLIRTRASLLNIVSHQ